MVSESLKLTLTCQQFNWLLELLSLWLGDVIFSELECVRVNQFLCLQDGSVPIFFFGV